MATRTRQKWITLRCAALLAIGAAWPHTAPVASPAGEFQRLRARTAELLELRETARLRGGVPLDSLAHALIATAGELERAGLDSLASETRYRAGGVLIRLRRHDEAAAELERSSALAVRARAVRYEVRALSLLADMRAGRDPQAALRAIRALLPRERALGNEIGIGDAYSTEARAWMALGRARESLAAAKRAARHYGRAGHERLRAAALMQASQALRFLDRDAEALRIADDVVALGERLELGRALPRAHLERASALRAMGREADGLIAVEAAMAIDRRLDDQLHLVSCRRFKASMLLQMRRYADCVRETDTLLALPGGDDDPTLALLAAQLRAAALMGLGRPAEAEATLAGRVERYERFRRSLRDDENRAATAAHASDAYTVLARSLLAQGRPEEAWRASERGRAFALKERLGAQVTPDPGAILESLRDGRAALVQFNNVGSELGTVFVFAADRLSAIPVDHPVDRADWRQALDRLSAPAATRGSNPALERLGETLAAVIAPHIPAGVERLLIVPPIDVPEFPFEALPIGTPGERLGDRWAVSYLPAATLLPDLNARAATPGRIVALADPVVAGNDGALAGLDERTRGQITRTLPGARAEARRLRASGARVLTGRDATLERLRRTLPAAVLHVATHAVEHPRLAPRGGLVLSGDPPLLTAAAVESLGVAADLVSLSACRALGSRAYPGEGAYGLARAFLAAGARTVVTTRWDIGDRAASRAMELFYEGLAAGLACDASLARAGRALEREDFSPRDRWAFMLLGLGPAVLAYGDTPGRSRGTAK